MATNEKREVRVGLGKLNSLMTKAQALRYGNLNMPKDLKKAGFNTEVFESDAEINGGVFFRVNYGKQCGSSANSAVCA